MKNDSFKAAYSKSASKGVNKCARTTKRYSNELLKLLIKPCTFLAIV